MADNPLNLLDGEADTPRHTLGDIPEPLRRRYLTDTRGGPGLGFYLDARTPAAAFRDQGHRLTTDRNDPQVIRDIVAVAAHRGWATVSVRGQTDFRREAWRAARQAGLEVRGYTPTDRDLQELGRRSDQRAPVAGPKPASPSPSDLGADRRLRVVEAVVNSRLVEPGDRARIMANARARVAAWLERSAPARHAERPIRRGPSRDR